MHKVWKKHQDAIFWVDINLAVTKGLKFYQTRSKRDHSSRNTSSLLYSESCLGRTLEKSNTKKYTLSPRPSTKDLLSDCNMHSTYNEISAKTMHENSWMKLSGASFTPLRCFVHTKGRNVAICRGGSQHRNQDSTFVAMCEGLHFDAVSAPILVVRTRIVRWSRRSGEMCPGLHCFSNDALGGTSQRVGGARNFCLDVCLESCSGLSHLAHFQCAGGPRQSAPSRLDSESNLSAGRLQQVVAFVELRNVEVFSVTDFLRAGSMRTPMNSEGVFGKSFT